MIPLHEDKQYLREHVCEKCPGTKWGKTTTCNVHNLHIGKIESCPQWEQQESPPLKDHDGQLALFDLEPAIEIVQKVEEELKDYHWLTREVDRLQQYLNNAIRIEGYGGGSGVSQYGIEASLPKGNGYKPSYLTIPEEKFEREVGRLKKLEEKVRRIDAAASKIEDEKERTVLECILDGVRMNMIAKHVGVSRQRLNEIKRSLVKRLAWEIYGDELIK